MCFNKDGPPWATKLPQPGQVRKKAAMGGDVGSRCGLYLGGLPFFIHIRKALFCVVPIYLCDESSDKKLSEWENAF